MKKIMFICLQKEIIEDLQVASLIDMDPDIELYCYNSVKDIETEAAGLNPDLVVLSYDALRTKEKWNFKGAQIAYHAKNKKELQEGARYGYPTIGQAISAEVILKNLKKPIYQPKEIGQLEGECPENKKQSEPAKSSSVSSRKEKKAEVQQEKVTEYVPEDKNNADDGLDEEFVFPEDDLFEEFSISDDPEPDSVPEKKESDLFEPQTDMKTVQKRQRKTQDIIEEEFRRDSGKLKSETKVITVYSAKGGVGKTTIASELATYLALVNVGRRRLRVCIVDYNIDFGDVRSTLKLGSDGPTLTDWAAEVQEYMEKGKSPENIQYSKEKIEKWLRHDKKSGLYVLVAPSTNEDSMGIETDSLSIILNNIVCNGEFDYVICDTGNNTRDSTMVALEKATTILLIMTQNVNTAICDKTFIETMKSIDFDLSHTKIVINNIMPQKSTSVSVQEIVEFFPYDCVGKLKFNTDVIKAGNLGEPLSFHPEHEFTKQLRSIVSYVLQEGSFNSESAPEKKKSFLERIFHKH